MDANEKRGRLIEAACALLSGADKKQLLTTNLNKAIFYLDLFAMRDFGQPISFAAFIALEQGPVVAKYEQRLIRAIEQSGLAKQEHEGLAMPVTLLAEPAYRIMNDEQRKLAQHVGMWISQLTAQKISEISHANPGWRFSYDRGLGASDRRPLSIDMNVAMQQIAEEDDPWLSIEASNSERKAIAAADAGEGEPW